MTRLRVAQRNDAAGIAAVHVSSWQSAYRGLVPDDDLDRLEVSDRTSARGYDQLALWVMADNARARAVYEAHGFIVDGAERIDERWQHSSVRYRRDSLVE